MSDLTPEQVRKLWTDALRSGQYKQARGQLRKDDKHCCLGVLCELAVKHGVTRPYDGREGTLVHQPKVMHWVGLADPHGAWGNKNWDKSLTGRNDAGCPFEGIADIIDSKPAGLFVDDER